MLALSEKIDNLFAIQHGLFYVVLGVTILMNVVSFLMFYFDSQKPVNSTSKANTQALTLYTFLLGGLGTLLSILIFKYQTKRNYFIIISICSIIINAVLLGLIF